MTHNRKRDPFFPEIELDYFNQYHMQVNMYWMEKTLEKIIIKERPDALLSTMGGQTALNIAI